MNIVINLLKKIFAPNKTNLQNEGTVKFFNYGKGFGFITLKESEEEIFVHKRSLNTKIRKGNQVTFDIEQSKKGKVAVNVNKVVKD